MARSRQYRERKEIALDQREKSCRDMRQVLSIAYNDTLRLNDQLAYIGEQVRLVEKTRAAYRDQFNIGQRTLLDLLNTQNEYFDARRAQVNADIDLSIAYLRSYSGMGRLLETLGMKRVDADGNPDESDLAPVDLAQLCPSSVPLDTTLDREALGRKVKAMMEDPSNSFIGARPQSAALPLTGQGGGEAVTNPLEAEISDRVTAWAAAWAGRDVKGYLDFYAPAFRPESGATRESWAHQREQRLGKAGRLRIEIQNLTVSRRAPDTAVAAFRQVHTSDTLSDTTDKTLEWLKVNGVWQIVRETSRAVKE